jgi:hypothetical protein
MPRDRDFESRILRSILVDSVHVLRGAFAVVRKIEPPSLTIDNMNVDALEITQISLPVVGHPICVLRDFE